MKSLYVGLSLIMFSSISNAGGYISYQLKAIDTKAVLETDDKMILNENLFGGSVALGINPANDSNKVAVRMDLSYDYNNSLRYNKIKDATNSLDMSIFNDTVMLNTYIDIPVGFSIVPYISASAGISMISAKINELDHGNRNKSEDLNIKFASGAGVGFSVNTSSNVTIDAGYKYIRYGKLNYEKKMDIKPTSNTYSIGFRIGF